MGLGLMRAHVSRRCIRKSPEGGRGGEVGLADPLENFRETCGLLLMAL